MAVRTTPGSGLLEGRELPDRYRLIRRIAAGGMATVWCAEDEILGRRVAVKLLSDHFAHDPRAVRRFQREARTAARLSGHPNIVTIFDVGQTAPGDGEACRPFIVMEYLPCGTVADALRVREVRDEDPLRWIREAAAALDFAHEHGVVHRDIKPANMLIDRSRSLHVGDFGIARIASEDTITRTGQLFGTAAYLAPEQARDEVTTPASDRYSLAVVAFELLTGERPFAGRHFAAQARAHIETPPPNASSRRPSLPPAIDAVLVRGMAKAPEERWPTAGAFADAVGAALRKPRARPRQRAAGAVPPPIVETPTVIVRRKRHPRAIALGALGAGAFAIGLLAGAGHDSGTGTSRNAGAAHQAPAAVRKHAAAARSTTPSRRAAATGSTGSSSARSTSSQAPGRATSTPSSSSGVSASALQARGHALLSSGDYGAAVPLLRQAVAAASPRSLTYAYALYDLGHALRLAGNPRAAVPILRQRLAIPNQTDIVRAELARALAALSAGSAPSAQGGAAAAPLRLHAPGGHDGKEAPGQLKKHGHEGGADGGD